MIRALYTAASAMLFGMRQQEVAADNLANTRTPGFKGETSAAGEFSGVLARRINASGGPAPAPAALGGEVLGRIGTGVYQIAKSNDFTEGGMRMTDAPLDFAIGGAGFFMVQTDDGIEYTRDGHFARDRENRLVTSNGLAVLDANGGEILLETDRIRVKGNGEILVGDELVATLGVADLDPDQAIRAGSSRFRLPDGVEATPVELGTNSVVRNGFLEEANVDAARTASSVLSTSRQFEASQKVFTTVDETLQRAVLEIGKVG